MINRRPFISKMMVITLAFVLIFSGIPLFGGKGSPTASAQSSSDISGHWSQNTMEHWVQEGLLNGYSDGSFKPDRKVTRGEFISFVNRAFGLEEESEIAFTDLAADSWAYTDVSKAVKAGYIQGYADGTIRVNHIITRQEAAVIIASVMKLSTEDTGDEEESFTDSPSIPKWSKAAIIQLAKLEVMNGYPNGSFNPLAPLTRAEAVVTLDRGFWESSYSYIIKKPGVYDFADRVGTIYKNVLIKVAGVTLRNVTIDGDLTLAAEINDGDTVLDNVNVNGSVSVSGGGKVSIKSGTIQSLFVQESTTFLELTLGSDTRIVSLTTYAVIHVLGQGIIEVATLSDRAIKSIFEKNPLNLLKPSTTGSGGNSVTPTATPTPTEEPTATPVNDLTPVVNGTAKAIVVTAGDVTGQVANATSKLIEYVQKSTGATLPLMSEAAAEAEAELTGSTLIYVGFIGDSADGDAISSELVSLDDDGFIIKSEKNANVITIIGPTDWGTEFGVYEFLERYVGVRWLMPGPDGEDVPLRVNLSVAEGSVVQEPSFISRAYDSNIENTPYRKAWTRYNRMHTRVQHDHIFFQIMPASKYQTQHPDFYPTGNGLINSDGGWQICYSNPATIEFVGNILIDYFNQNPDATSHSLAVNDNGGFCEQNPNHPSYPDKINSIGYQDMSDIYFNWVNEVAEKVLEVHPDKYLGVIAYHEVYDPPTNVVLNPNVIVYITDERLSWIDPSLEQANKTFTESWKAAAPGVAFYEYLYGTPYSLPRPYFHQMSENYKYAEQLGVVAQFTELYPNFGEGPKPWLASKLQWNASADVDDLLDEWYVGTVGAEAAPYLRQYFEIWENFWEVRILETTWFENWLNSNPRRNFMNFYDSSYLKYVTEQDMALSRDLMESVVEKAVTQKQKARADILMKAFEYYEASALSYPSDEPVAAFTTSGEAITLLDEMQIKMSKAEYRLQLNASFKTHEVLQQPLDPRNYGAAWSGVRSEEVNMLIRWIKDESDNGEVKSHIESIIATVESELVRNYMKFIIAEATNQQALNENTSFEIGIENDIDDTPPWWYWVDYGQDEDNVHQTDIQAHTGDYSIEAVGLKIGGPVMDGIEVDPGYHSLSAYYYVPEGSTSNGNISLFINFWDANGTHLGNAITTNKLARTTAGEWALIEWVGEIPSKIGGVPVKKVQFGTNIFDFANNELIYVDDFRLLRLSDAYVPDPDEEEEESSIINHNSSFEYGNTGIEDALPWSYWIDNAMGTMARSNEQARTSDYSLKMSGVTVGALSQIVAAPEPSTNTYKLSAYYYVPENQATNGTVKLFMNFRNEAHQHLDAIPTTAQAVNVQPGQWNLLEWTGVIPSEIDGQAVKHLLLGIEPKNFAAGESVYIDDVELNLVPIPPEPAALNANTSFEYGNTGIQDALPWSYWIDNPSGSMARSNENVRTSNNSLKMSGVTVGALSQIVAAPESSTNTYRLSAYYYVPENQATNGTVKLFMNFRNEAHQHLGAIPTTAQAVNVQPGQWNLLEWTGVIPSVIDGQAVKHLLLGIEPKNFAAGESVYIDDVELRLVPEPSETVAMNENISFEQGNAGVEDALPWSYWIDNVPTGTMGRSNEQALTADYSLKMSGVTAGALSQIVAAPESSVNTYKLSAYYYVPENQATNGTVKLFMNFRNAAHQHLDAIPTTDQPVNVQPGQWNLLEWTGVIPSELDGQAVKHLLVGIEPKNFAAGESVYIDNITLTKMN
ncbi:hypothetical protein BK133_11650 [Paenibacillus sp. FSL H8-0548]|uniref:DUF4838 domain-containing protein n=1 Tax=Paenibacillus sp. FSL H8-0548 TaxID=1920422 RepID=UPI00096D3BFB|nr:DUF4838 domain-containing protein [Paenibacillus sp. FSL H8-0548]OMF34658.1 hypothetical protein BK133_11650 [Paenibacillus sp. FSL H8-0548]